MLSAIQTAWYRCRQFWHGLHATPAEDAIGEVAEILTPAAFLLFRRLPIDGQQHSINVLKTLQQEGNVPTDLAVAALLHDVGKAAAGEAGVELNLWWRGPLVLLETFTPTLLDRLASPDPQLGWRYLFHVHQAHARIGALWAREAGCSELACWLITHHQEKLSRTPSPKHHKLLGRLQHADSLN